MKRSLTILARWLWSLTAFVLVTAAVMVTVIRLLLPQLGDYREDLQNWVSRYVQQPVAIEHVEASWRGWTPELHLGDIRLLDAKTKRVITRFESASLGINLRASITQRQLVPGKLIVSGVQLSLLRSRDGAIRIEGVDPEQTQMPGERQNALAYWLLNQRDLSIESATITWHDQKTLIRPVVFSNVELEIRSDADRTQLVGHARLPSEVGELFQFRIDAEGDLLTTGWSGRSYVEGRNINPSILLNYQNWLGLHIANGRIGFKLWGDWRNARIAQVNGSIDGEDIAVGVANQRFVVRSAGGKLHAARDLTGRWAINVNALNMRTRNGTWPETDLEMAVIPGIDPDKTALVARAGFVRLDDVAPILPSIDVIPPNIRTAVSELQPRGDLHDLRVGFFPERETDQRFYVHASFSEVSTQPALGWPGISALHGTLRTDAMAGSLNLDNRALQLDIPERLDEPAWIEHLRGVLSWRRTQTGWWLGSDKLEIGHAALDTILSGHLDLPEDGAPVADVIAQFEKGSVDAVRQIVPREILPERGYNWLTTALEGGTLLAGGGVFRGPVSAFPFDQAEGVFKLRFDVEDGTLKFHPLWPRLENMQASIEIAGRRLVVHSPAAKIGEMNLSEVKLVIPDLGIKERRIDAHGKASGSATAASNLIAQTPLKKTLGKRLEQIELNGDLSVDLNVVIPLQRGKKPYSSGVAFLDSNVITVLKPKLAFDDVSGRIEFEGPQWHSKVMSARYLGKPVKLDVSGGKDGETPYSRYLMRGSADRDFVSRQLDALVPDAASKPMISGLLNRLDGSTDWQAELESTGEPGKESRTLSVTSELRGMSVDLPAPMGKPAWQTDNFELSTDLRDEGEQSYKLSYGDTVSMNFLLSRPEQTLLGLDLGFGSAARSDAASGKVRVNGNLAQFSVTDWLLVRDSLRATSAGDKPSAKPGANTSEPDGMQIALTFDELEAGGRLFANQGIEIKDDANAWLATLNGPDLAGTVTISGTENNSPTLVAELQRLHIIERAVPPRHYVAMPNNLPALAITSESTRLGEIALGAMTLRTSPAENALNLEELTLSAPEFEIRSTGTWSVLDGTQASNFDIAIEAKELGKLLGAFGYNGAAVEGGETYLGIRAQWTGSPAEFALESLGGDLELKVDNGRLLDVDPKAGRIFGLISIQSVKRRLTLDFEDLFQKGLSFDSIEGEFELERGHAYTNNLAMNGPSARIEITGRTGLADQDYDQVVTVTPQFAGSLPIAGAFFGPAGAGVGAVLFIGQKVFKSLPEQLDKVLSRQYMVTGDWQDPVVEQVRGFDLSFGGQSTNSGSTN